MIIKITDEEIKEQLSAKLFKDNNLYSMMNICFDNSPYQAINAAYPNRFKPDDFKNFHNCSEETKSTFTKSSRF